MGHRKLARQEVTECYCNNMCLLHFSSEPTVCQQCVNSCEFLWIKGCYFTATSTFFLSALIIWFPDARTLTCITTYVSNGESCRMFPLQYEEQQCSVCALHFSPLSYSMSTEEHYLAVVRHAPTSLYYCIFLPMLHIFHVTTKKSSLTPFCTGKSTSVSRLCHTIPWTMLLSKGSFPRWQCGLARKLATNFL